MSKEELRKAYDDAEARLNDARKRSTPQAELIRLERERDRAFQAMFQVGA